MALEGVRPAVGTEGPAESARYAVRWGDNLTTIARRHGTTVSKLVALNPWLADRPRYLIYAGRDQLVVPAPASALPRANAVKLDRNGDPILRVGQRHAKVVELRALLIEAGYAVPAEGDTYDGALFEAVSHFQSESSFYNGASVEGVVGPAVWAALRHEAAERRAFEAHREPARHPSAPTMTEPEDGGVNLRVGTAANDGVARSNSTEHPVSDTPPPPLVFDTPRRVIQYGRVGEDARMAQRMLNRAGYRVEVDARFFTEGQNAAEQFQRDHGLGVDGKIYTATWPVLLEESLEPSTAGRVRFEVEAADLESLEQRVAFDVFQNLAYDDPDRMDDLMRLTGAGENASRREVRLTLEHVNTLARLSRDRGLPFTPANAEVLRHLGTGRSGERLNYHGASMVHYFLTRRPPEDNREFDDIIRDVTRDREPTPSLARAVIYRESRFNPNAGSHAGAVGLMQLMPATARELGVSNRRNPRQNLTGGTEYLDRLIRRFDNWFEALAAYNGGPGRMGSRELLEMPLESVNYVNRVTLTYLYYANRVGEDPRFLIGAEATS